MLKIVFVIIMIILFQIMMQDDFKNYLSHQSIFVQAIKNEYEGLKLRFTTKDLISLRNFPEITKVFNKTQDTRIIAFMIESFCNNLKLIMFLILSTIFWYILYIINKTINKELLYMDILFPLVIILIFIYLNYFRRCENSMDNCDKEFKDYLIKIGDSSTLNEIQHKTLNIDKARILINRFYETNDQKYLIYAIQSFIMNSYFIILIIGTLLAFLLFILVFVR